MPIKRVEDLSDAVLGARLEAMQMSQAPLLGSLAFSESGGVVYSSGRIDSRITLSGTLSETMVTLGTGLLIAPGSRHWLHEEVASGSTGVFLPGDQHEALYRSGSLYAAATLPMERLEEIAARKGLVLDRRTLGGTGLHRQPISREVQSRLRTLFEHVHAGRCLLRPFLEERLGDALLDALIMHFARNPCPVVGTTNTAGHARIVARARDYVIAHLHEALSTDAIAAAAYTSRRTLFRAFVNILDETPNSYVRKLRLHRIRQNLASDAEHAVTIALVANRWGVGELGRLSGWYRDLFGELPSDTLARHRGDRGHTHDDRAILARSA